ncbi:DUF3466 family protein [Paludisphaera soli]|uniref:DUF3466 family protein n=1 Tax=Paludisphaera soli TaxID=2712865 RepID=UPI0013EB8289|nr:DUF3466 family protein [Paludisphaera soli]
MILRRNRGGRTRIVAALAASAWLAAPAWGSPTYSIRRMENVNFSRPNDSGQVVSDYGYGSQEFFLADGFGPRAGSPGRTIAEGTPDAHLLGGPITDDRAILLNNREQGATMVLVPASTIRPGATGSAGQAALLDGGAVTLLGTLGGLHSAPRALNDSGQVVGRSNLGDGSVHAFRSSGGTMQDLGALPGGGSSYATAINNAGDVVGYSAVGPSANLSAPSYWNGARFWETLDQPDGSAVSREATTHAVLFRDGQVVDLGTLGGGSSYASGINDAGLIVGTAETASGQSRAFAYQDGKMTDLGVLTGTPPSIIGRDGESTALDVDDLGRIVGSANGRAFLYQDGKMADLNDFVTLPPHTTLVAAYSINNLGQIMAGSIRFNEDGSLGQDGFDTYLLTPTELGAPNYAIETPEPTALALPLLAAAWMGVRALRRRDRR